MSRFGQGTEFRSDLTASNTPPPHIVRSFLNIEYSISGGYLLNTKAKNQNYVQ